MDTAWSAALADLGGDHALIAEVIRAAEDFHHMFSLLV